MRIRFISGFMIALVTVAPSRGQTPLGTDFTYQGQLKENGAPIDGAAHLRFSLWNAAGSGSPPVGGSQIGVSQLVANVAVVNGLFTVPLNASGQFGANAFNGEGRWLQIEVCADAGCGTLTVLAPRQGITAVPYAMTALSTLSTGHSLDAADGNPTDALFVDNAGKVGIGNIAPDNTLHVLKGSAGVVTGHGNAPLVVENSTNAYINLLTPDANERGMLFGSPTPGAAAGGIVYNAAATPEGLQFRTGGNVNRMVIDSTGNVGIGTTTPVAKLVLNGPENSGIANGVLSLISPGGVLGNFMTLDGNEINGWSHLHINPDAATDIMMAEGGGNVGIGTGAPAARLHVVGGTDTAPAGGGYLVTGSTTGTNISIDNNEIMARNNGAVATLTLNANGGDVAFGGAIDIGYQIIQGNSIGRVAMAQCPSGTRVISGGCRCGGNNYVNESFPYADATTWQCVCSDDGTQVLAICANVK